MRKAIILSVICFAISISIFAQKNSEQKTKHLTYNEFLHKVWNFENNPTTFIYKGKVPAVIDFYADWCGPCRRVAPIMEKLAEEYEGRLVVYKINVDQEKELASAFQAKSIPMVLFIPLEGQPMKQVGAMPEESYRKIVEEHLLK